MSEPSSSSKDDKILRRRHSFVDRNDEKSSTNDERMCSARNSASELSKIFSHCAKTDEDFSKETVMKALYIAIEKIPAYKFNSSNFSPREQVAAAMTSDVPKFVLFMIKHFSTDEMDDFVLKVINLRFTEWKKPDDDSSAVAQLPCPSQATTCNQGETREKLEALASILTQLESEQGKVIHDPEFLRTMSSAQLDFFEQLERCAVGKSLVRYALSVYSLEELKELDEKIHSFQRSMDVSPVPESIARSQIYTPDIEREALPNQPILFQDELGGFSTTIETSSTGEGLQPISPVGDQKRLLTPETCLRSLRCLHIILNRRSFRYCSVKELDVLSEKAKQCDSKEFETFMSQNFSHKEIDDIILKTFFYLGRVESPVVTENSLKSEEFRNEKHDVLTPKTVKVFSINKPAFSPQVEQKFDEMSTSRNEKFKMQNRESLIWKQSLPPNSSKECFPSTSVESVEATERFEVSADHSASYQLFNEMERNVIKLLEIYPFVTSDVLKFTQKWFSFDDLTAFYDKLDVYEKHRDVQEINRTQKQLATVEASARPSEHLATSSIETENDDKQSLLDSILERLNSPKIKLTQEKFYSLLTRKESEIFSVIRKSRPEVLQSQILCFSRIDLKEFDTKLWLIMKISDAKDSKSTRLALEESILKKLIRSSIMASSTSFDSVPVFTKKEKGVINSFEFVLRTFSDKELKSFDAKIGVAEIETKKNVSEVVMRRLDVFSPALDNTQQKEGDQKQCPRNIERNDNIPSALLANLSLNDSFNRREQSAATSFHKAKSTKNVANKNLPPECATRHCTNELAHLLNRTASQYVSPSSRLPNPESILSDCDESTEDYASTSSVSAVERDLLGEYGFDLEQSSGCSMTQHSAYPARRSTLTPTMTCAQVEEILLRNTKNRLNDVSFDHYDRRTPDIAMPSCACSQKDINEFQNEQKSPNNLLKSENPSFEASTPLPQSFQNYISYPDFALRPCIIPHYNPEFYGYKKPDEDDL
ncbi:hypothetical protein CAEBREN_18853 [Caenorhabditis brenneri]|uniref:Uncharacterized protein n=1 Tax=Caenorhabditis brenneri TaxID=135651 RepID=G0NEV8_CAEBE|nr:hypothetical protein CAEBREN_18853 [Caenorhabditis brenneri]